MNAWISFILDKIPDKEMAPEGFETLSPHPALNQKYQREFFVVLLRW